MFNTLGELFDEPPAQWGHRGDPYAWSALATHFACVPIPTSAARVKEALLAGFRSVVGVDLTRADGEETVFLEELAHGGMSSGHVHLPTWRDRLIPLLVRRSQEW